MIRRFFIALALALVAGVSFAQNAPVEGIAFASGARTSTATTADLSNVGAYRGIHVIIDVTAFTSGTWTPHISAKDPASGKYYDLLAGTAIAGTGTTVLKVYPGITASGNVSASDVLPRTFRIQIAGAATPISTFSVGYTLLP